MTATGVRRRGPGSRAGKQHPTRQEIFEAALVLAGEGGLSTMSVEAVTREAGHAKGTFYVHFDDRTELLVALHDCFHDEVFQDVRSSSSGMPAGPDRARTRIVAFLDACRRQPGVRAMLRDARAVPEIADLVQKRNAEAAAELVADLTGSTPWPKETAFLLVVAVGDAAVQELDAGRRLPRLRSALLAMVPD
jgi:TetR/AcrR family transcriptional regulator, transcriptional repressor for nem operon